MRLWKTCAKSLAQLRLAAKPGVAVEKIQIVHIFAHSRRFHAQAVDDGEKISDSVTRGGCGPVNLLAFRG
jgi:hypothetical protein